MKKFIFILLALVTTLRYHAQCWKAVASESYHSLAIKTDGTLWAWGINGMAELGDGTTQDRWSPLQIGNATDWKSIDVGHEHSLALKTDGTIWGWGDNNYGQTGHAIYVNIPAQIGTSTDWEMVSAGSFYSMGIKTDGTLWGWGKNEYGNLGTGIISTTNTPTQIGNSTDWKYICAGRSMQSLGIKTDGSLWAWGHNDKGQLGDGTTTDKNTPVQIGTAKDWKSISTGDGHSFAIKNNGTIWAWGDNFMGQLGDGSLVNKTVPTQIGTDNNWSFICSGGQGGLAIKTDNTLWAWGSNYCMWCSGNAISPTLIGSNWKFCSGGVGNSFAIRSDETLWSWGYNARGELGNGTPDQGTDTPTYIADANCLMTLGVRENSYRSTFFSVFPNPACKELHVKTLHNTPFSMLVITDVSGKVVLEQKDIGNNINVENLQKGVYFLRLSSNEGTFTNKFIKE